MFGNVVVGVYRYENTFVKLWAPVSNGKSQSRKHFPKINSSRGGDIKNGDPAQATACENRYYSIGGGGGIGGVGNELPHRITLEANCVGTTTHKTGLNDPAPQA